MPGEPTRLESVTAADTRATSTTARRNKKRITIAIGIATLFVAASVGVGVYVANRGDRPLTFLEVYLTDYPANISRLDVRLASITVGSDATPLQLESAAFDLLQLRGPGGAMRVARGMVPVEENAQIRIAFQSATAQVDHQSIRLDIPEKLLSLGHDYRLSKEAASSVLFDINVNKSVSFDGAKATFQPFVDTVYVVAQGSALGNAAADDEANPSPRSASTTSFSFAKGEPPREQELEQPPTTDQTNPFANLQRDPTPTRTAPTDDPQPTESPEPTDNDTAAEDDGSEGGSEDEAGFDDYYTPVVGDSYSKPGDYAGTVYGWLVQFEPDASSPESIPESVAAAGAELVYRFASVPAAYVLGTPLDAENLTHDPYVTYVEPLMPIGLHLSSSKTALRIPELMSGLTAIKDASGRPIDGRGVGVAVVDSGIDGMHPDLAHRLLEGDAAPVQFNYKVESIALVDMVYTDTTSGHGTHVAGIVGGRGTKETGMKGVAPGSTLYGFGIGELANTLWPNQAFDWIVQNGAHQDPPIRVVTNSWGSMGAYDPNSLTSKLVDQMVAQGMVVVFSAGNSGGDGSQAMTSRECRIPKTGVICVAWYNDMDLGSRTGTIDPASSRGLSGDRSTWPDISAPGGTIRSARTPFGWVTGIGLTEYYVTLEGTSMAAPHVAGAAALMLQANPNLSPAQVESIIKSTALKYADGGSYDGSGSHVGKGHGLLDAYAAVQQAKAT